jgi:hypothetical protein
MAEDVSILQEIDEALRADKAAQFWARNSSAVITFCIVIVLAAAVSELWKNHLRGVHERQTSQLVKAITLAEAGKYNEAISGYERAEEDGGQLALLATLQRAQTLAEMKQEDKAIGVYEGIARDGKAPVLFRDYAAVQADVLAHNLALATGKPPAVTEGAKEARQSGRPYAAFLAEIDALRSGDPKSAATALNGVIADKDVPFSERSRAGMLLESLGRADSK